VPKLPAPALILPYLTNALAALLAGALFRWLHVPLPWMLGAMAATGALAWSERAAVLRPTRPAALILLGLGLGQSFTPPVMVAVGLALPWIVLAAVLSVAVGVAVSRLFARLAGTDAETGYYASVPGGVVVMAILAQRAGVAVAPVTLAQTIRVMVVVVLVPPLVTWLAPHGSTNVFNVEGPEVHLAGLALLLVGGLVVGLVVARSGFANPWMLGPCGMVMLLSAFGLLPSGVPGWMIDVAQVGMGMALGQRLSRRFLLSSRRLASASLFTTVLLVAIMAALAIGLGLLADLPIAAAVLGMAPGGMPEMTITAKALELAVPLVLGFHLVRTLLCNLFVAPMWRLAVKLGLLR
jgi:membrane AbrB-like protein